MARSPLTAAPPAKNARLRGEPVARAVFADLPALADGGLRLLPFVVIGAFPVRVGAYAQHWTLSVAAGIAAVAAFFLSMGQRALRRPARALRRRIGPVSGQVTRRDGHQQELGRADLLAPLERGCAISPGRPRRWPWRSC
jgi:hypothetical protein